MQNYFCEVCEEHWQGNPVCPHCGEKFEIHKTMTPEEAKERGLIGNNTIKGEF